MQTNEEDDVLGRRDIRIALLAALAFFGLFGLWLALMPLDAGVVARGVVVVSGNRLTLQHREGGTITRVHVQEGEAVSRGQVLLDLSAPELLAQERALTSQTLELEAVRARLASERDGIRTDPPARWQTLAEPDRAQALRILARHEAERNVREQTFQARQSSLALRQAQIRVRLGGYQEQLAALETQSSLAQADVEAFRSLETRGFAAPIRVRASQRAVAEITARQAELRGLMATSREELAEARVEQLVAQSARREDIAAQVQQAEMELADLLPRLHAAQQMLGQTRISAPADGSVVNLAFFNGGAVVQPGERMMDIVPTERGVVIEADIRPEHADDLRTGQRAEIRFSALSDRSIPRIVGTIQSVSADRLVRAETGESFFRARIDIADADLLRLATASRSQIGPGLPVEILIPLRSRTALQYLLEPLDQAVFNSLHEQ